MERIQKIIAASGLCARRKAEELIAAGRVRCNGELVKLGDVAAETDEILVDDAPLPAVGKFLYLMLHKPRGYVTTLSDEKGRKTVELLVRDCGQRVVPVGRLDMDSEGLLLLSNDGAFVQSMTHPSHVINKVYEALVSGYAPGKERQLAEPVVLDGYRIRPPKVRLLWVKNEKAALEITIHEGRNRQIRKMAALCGMQVKRLRRIAEGAVRLGDLPVGKWRFLSEAELQMLKCESTREQN